MADVLAAPPRSGAGPLLCLRAADRSRRPGRLRSAVADGWHDRTRVGCGCGPAGRNELVVRLPVSSPGGGGRGAGVGRGHGALGVRPRALGIRDRAAVLDLARDASRSVSSDLLAGPTAE